MKLVHFASSMVLAFLALPSPAASVAFNQAFENALALPEADGDLLPAVKEPFIPKLLRQLRELGTDEEVVAPATQVLRDPSRIGEWNRAINLTSLMGPDFDRTELVAAVRDGMQYSFKKDEERQLKRSVTAILCSYGTLDDLEKLNQYAKDVLSYDPQLGAALIATIQLKKDRDNMKAAEGKKGRNTGKDTSLEGANPIESARVVNKSEAYQDTKKNESTKDGVRGIEVESASVSYRMWVVWLLIALVSVIAARFLIKRRCRCCRAGLQRLRDSTVDLVESTRRDGRSLEWGAGRQ